ncbi:bacillithiol system redox-active protein YtxJ [Paenibacillus sp. DMB20]|uniref:bacillithiol system redox-active protein YtxJ n=1 Tax=Paenibacillus sp. DMB20 TaxID=1642570 RepID=UPI0006274FDB|nr:bacillithiol system redox-active protein YtxJ [Paenibacillus sp. DMB20]KKO52193.1 general stress protein [Paenibacillus sp. DMB20]
MATMTKMTTSEQLRTALESTDRKALLIFKHSTRCPISSGAYEQVTSYLNNQPNEQVDYALIDVIEHRPVSNEAAEALGVKHESPQVILVRQGEQVWHTSHSQITAETLRGKLNGL